MVTLQILVLPFLVRVRVAQHRKLRIQKVLSFSFAKIEGRKENTQNRDNQSTQINQSIQSTQSNPNHPTQSNNDTIQKTQGMQEQYAYRWRITSTIPMVIRQLISMQGCNSPLASTIISTPTGPSYHGANSGNLVSYHWRIALNWSS